FVTTHLEVAGRPAAGTVQLRQAEELLEGPARADGPVVLVGDFNSPPGGAAYERLVSGGFEDAWLRANPSAPHASEGFTCCHRHPLADPGDRLRARIDLILTRGGVAATEAF